MRARCRQLGTLRRTAARRIDLESHWKYGVCPCSLSKKIEASGRVERSDDLGKFEDMKNQQDLRLDCAGR